MLMTRNTNGYGEWKLESSADLDKKSLTTNGVFTKTIETVD